MTTSTTATLDDHPSRGLADPLLPRRRGSAAVSGRRGRLHRVRRPPRRRGPADLARRAALAGRRRDHVRLRAEGRAVVRRDRWPGTPRRRTCPPHDVEGLAEPGDRRRLGRCCGRWPRPTTAAASSRSRPRGQRVERRHLPRRTGLTLVGASKARISDRLMRTYVREDGSQERCHDPACRSGRVLRLGRAAGQPPVARSSRSSSAAAWCWLQL